MPTYQYSCLRCGEFEVQRLITDKPKRRCPRCKAKVRRLISRTSFRLMGGGWYKGSAT